MLKCIRCGKEYDEREIVYTCECNGLLDVVIDYDSIDVSIDELRKRKMGVWRYKEFIPVEKKVTLEEGGTPLYTADRIGKNLGIELYVKYEGGNPTGSFKDRGMTVGVSKAIECGMETVACASTGNTSASLAIYAAKANLKCIVLLPKGKVALGKLAQAIMHGAEVIAIDGNFDDALRVVRKLTDMRRIYLLNSVNPFRPEGQKTIAHEIADQLNFEVPDKVIVPMGNCANIWAIYKGFLEFCTLLNPEVKDFLLKPG